MKVGLSSYELAKDWTSCGGFQFADMTYSRATRPLRCMAGFPGGKVPERQIRLCELGCRGAVVQIKGD